LAQKFDHDDVYDSSDFWDSQGILQNCVPRSNAGGS